MRASTFFTISALSAAVYAKTDLAGCTSSVIVEDGSRLVQWWVPETGEICSGLDCGGGRGPVKQNVPGCPAYTGSLEYEPSYLPGGGPDGWVNAPATPTGGSVAEETVKPVVIIGGPTLGGGQAQVTPAPESGSGNSNSGSGSSGSGSSGSDTPVSNEDDSDDVDEEDVIIVTQENGTPITQAPAQQSGFQTSTRLSDDDEESADATASDDDDVASNTSSGLAAAATWPSMLTPIMGAMAMVAAVAI